MENAHAPDLTKVQSSSAYSIADIPQKAIIVLMNVIKYSK